MITVHQFLDKYPIASSSKKLIVGTIHPHDHSKFMTSFFYGNENSLWNILSEAFPKELSKPINLNGILSFLRRREISMSDTIISCERKSNSQLDEDLVPLQLNHDLKQSISNSEINEIFLTSGFGKNNAFRIFYKDILGLRIEQAHRQKRSLVLPSELFGREVKVNILYSPSRTANTGLTKSKLYLQNKVLFSESKRPIHDFKVWYYQQMFGALSL